MPPDGHATALITGAGQRIGRALALDFAAQGWKVGLHCHASRRAAEALAAEIKTDGGTAAVLVADLTMASEVEALIPNCAAALGPPSCLVNNAAIFAYDE